nr:glucokinase [Pseudorhodobacter aquimaris]
MPFPLSLVADIGGTSTSVALAKGPELLSDTIRHFQNADFAGVEALLQSYLSGAGDLDGACVAVAGPVRGGVANLTALDWTIDEAMLKNVTGATTVAILNDLQAQGHALGHIAPEKLLAVIPGPLRPEEGSLVVGVGCGFNAVPVYETSAGRIIPPSECGHARLPLKLTEDIELAQYLQETVGYVAVEEVLSRRGLERLGAFVSNRPSTPRLVTAVPIPKNGTEKAAQLFVRLLGAYVGDLALTYSPFGGIYLCGKLAREFGPLLEGKGFESAFVDKGPFSLDMRRFAVRAIMDSDAILTGCAVYLNENLHT